MAIDDGGGGKTVANGAASWWLETAARAPGTLAVGAFDRHRGPSQGAPGKVQFAPPPSAISRIANDAETLESVGVTVGWAQPAARAPGVAIAHATNHASAGASRTTERVARDIVMKDGRSEGRGPRSRGA